MVFYPKMLQGMIQKIETKETYPLRSVVLRGWAEDAACPFDGDEDKTTSHFGFFIEDNLVGIASFYFRPHPELPYDTMIQLRGMATHPQYTGRGVGKQLLAFALNHYSPQADAMWCNARTGAMGFYQKMGFKTHGKEFKIPGVGPHVVMYVRLVG